MTEKAAEDGDLRAGKVPVVVWMAWLVRPVQRADGLHIDGLKDWHKQDCWERNLGGWPRALFVRSFRIGVRVRKRDEAAFRGCQVKYPEETASNVGGKVRREEAMPWRWP